jgi:hypothetical protein
VQEGQLEMDQALVTLKKAKNRLITQAEAARELGVRVRHIKRLVRRLAARRQSGHTWLARKAVAAQAAGRQERRGDPDLV